jgi:glucosamine--fructose-6-phosphate aminotransferase (isomerizing)
MCGIVGAVAERNIVPVLIEGLRRLEYRGYDSAGIAVLDSESTLGLCRTVGKVADLERKLETAPLSGRLGVAHTRWATHGGVTEANAHPHLSGDRVAVIHNGIIENFAEIKAELITAGYQFRSETDTEVAAHLIHEILQQGVDLVEAVRQAVARFAGAYALLVIDAEDPERLVVSRVASPLVIGLGLGENFVASGVPALLPVTQRFIYLEQGDLAEIRRESVRIFDRHGRQVEREVHESALSVESVEKGPYRHFMLKEIYDQPSALAETLYGRVAEDRVLPASLGPGAEAMLGAIANIHIVACGTSYHAGLVGRDWIETLADLPCQVEIASEYRYRRVVVPPRCS